ncbi:MAG TPA: glutaredoxin family protein [Dehalococcoidia bacterium]|nr:glutaredoxin family protein [Dehalococcoidia bacterium]
MARQPQVVIYIHSNEEPSQKLRAFLKDLGVSFVEKDAWNNNQVRRELMVLGYDSTPVTLIDGTPIRGFKPDELTRELRLHSNPLNPPGQEPR